MAEMGEAELAGLFAEIDADGSFSGLAPLAPRGISLRVLKIAASIGGVWRISAVL